MRVKLTPHRVEELKAPASGDLLVWDESLAGFGLRVGKRRRSWLIQYRDACGRSRRLKLGTFPALSLAAARAKAAEALAGIERGEDPAAESDERRQTLTLREFSEHYLEHVVRYGKKTASTDRCRLERTILPRLGDLRIDRIDKQAVRKLHADLAATPFEANRTAALLSYMFNLAVTEFEYLPAETTNPVQGLRRYKERKRERFLSGSEVGRLGAALRRAEERGENPLALAAIRLLLLTSARMREITAATWSEVNLDAGCLELRDSKTGPKTIHLSAAAVQLLASLPKLHDTLVFPSRCVPGLTPRALALVGHGTHLAPSELHGPRSLLARRRVHRVPRPALFGQPGSRLGLRGPQP